MHAGLYLPEQIPRSLPAKNGGMKMPKWFYTVYSKWIGDMDEDQVRGYSIANSAKMSL